MQYLICFDIYSRAKLYRYDTSSNPAEWKERGTGEVKLLRHKTKNTVRVVMRRDKTLKICANHFVTPWMELKPNCGSDRAWVWSVLADYADEQLKPELLAIRFANAESKFSKCMLNSSQIWEAIIIGGGLYWHISSLFHLFTDALVWKETFEKAKKIVGSECEIYAGKTNPEQKRIESDSESSSDVSYSESTDNEEQTKSFKQNEENDAQRETEKGAMKSEEGKDILTKNEEKIIDEITKMKVKDEDEK